MVGFCRDEVHSVTKGVNILVCTMNYRIFSIHFCIRFLLVNMPSPFSWFSWHWTSVRKLSVRDSFLYISTWHLSFQAHWHDASVHEVFDVQHCIDDFRVDVDRCDVRGTFDLVGRTSETQNAVRESLLGTTHGCNTSVYCMTWFWSRHKMVLVVMDWGWSRCQLLLKMAKFKLKAGMPLIVRKRGKIGHRQRGDELVCSGRRKSVGSVHGVSSVGTTLIFCLLLFASVIQPSHQSDATDNGLQVRTYDFYSPHCCLLAYCWRFCSADFYRTRVRSLVRLD